MNPANPSSDTLRDTTTTIWAICDAPPDGCGFGPRRRVLVKASISGEPPSCPGCGSGMRVAKNQSPKSAP